jgi:hypothetical protein
MPSQGSITLYEYNDETVLATIYEDVAKTTPMDLTNAMVEFIYKLSTASDDTTGLTLQATILDALAGEVSVFISNTNVDLNKKFFRFDVVAAGERKTAIFGSVTVVNL